MWRLDRAQLHDLPDVTRFVELINQQSLFVGPTPVSISRAPGRLDLMGGIADYSGALVLELPLSVATLVAAQATTEPSVTVRSTSAADLGAAPEVALPLAALTPGGAAMSYAEAHALLGSDPAQSWAAYVIGTLVVLQRERGLRLDRGLRLLVHSSVPVGKGVSSSAALEVATMQAVCDVYGLRLAGRELALLCQQVENLVVGAPCGIMDQMTAACGEQGALLALLCQPAELQPAVQLPPELEVWGIDSGIRHAVSGADYGSVRIGAFMGYRIIAQLVGLPVVGEAEPGVLAIDDPRWHGYLANITPSEWAQHYQAQVPKRMTGAEFLARYGGTTDPVTRIDPGRSYAVRQPTAHPIEEHHRVQLFRALLLSGADSEEQRVLLGELMYQSHASYSACGLGADGTDQLVELVRAAGPASGLYGAKITGGGSGGTVAVLTQRDRAAAVQAVATRYQQMTGRSTALLHGSSPGAEVFGVVRLTPS